MTIRLLIVAALTLALVAAAGSGRASGESASATVSVTAIASGLGQSCALTRTGGVKCWGANGHDELGNGTMRDSWTPVDVSGLGSGVTAIANGVRHGCALTRVGGVKCWGINANGTLGDGTDTRRFSPVDVAGLSSGVTAIAAGFDHSCALTNSGGVKCWGYNRFGELGDGTTSHRWTPVDVSGLGSGATAIAAGGFLSCALTSAAGVKCWGGAAGDRSRPVDVPGLSGVRAIVTGGVHGCALTTTGGVKCWGDNRNGRLGDGTTTDRSTPVAVSGLASGVTAISAGSFHSCALTRTGGVKCWGLNGSGQLGDRTTVNRRGPVGVIGFGAAKATLAVVSRSVTVTPMRVAAVKLRCGSLAGCQGALTLTASVEERLVGSSARRVRVKLGSGALSIAAGRTQTVKVKLTARGFELLVRAKRLSTRLRVSYSQPAGTTTASRTITLIAPKAANR